MGNNYYNYEAISKIDTKYKMIIGGRCTGKTYGWGRNVLKEYLKTGKTSVYIRRWDMEIGFRTMAGLFHPHADWLEKTANGKWNSFVYQNQCFYLARYEVLENGKVTKVSQDQNAFCHTYSLINPDKAIGAIGDISQICFDNFIPPNRNYIKNEFFIFKKLIGFIVGGKTDIPIYMLANPIDDNCPYFHEMNIAMVKTKPGKIYVYQIPKSTHQVAYEYID